MPGWGLDFEALVERARKRVEISSWLDGQFEQRESVVDVNVAVELHQNLDVDVDAAKERFDDEKYLGFPEIGPLIRMG